jgi:hypothetical protein
MANENLQLYNDLLARVRGDKNFHSIKNLVQPDNPEVKEVAGILHDADDFVGACQDFVNSFTDYRREVGDYWATPAETMAPRCPVCESTELVPVNGNGEIYRCSCGWEGEPVRSGDCDDKAILLVSLLRNYVPADQVFCAFGTHRNGRTEGHMWVVMENGDEDRIIEATASSESRVHGDYETMAIFNDIHAFSYPSGIKEFSLIPVKEEIDGAA